MKNLDDYREFKSVPVGSFFIIPGDGPCPLYHKIDDKRALPLWGRVETLLPQLIVLVRK